MKIFILFLLITISPIELRRHNEDYYELEDLLNNNYERPKHHSNKPYVPEPTDEDQYVPSLPDNEKPYPSRKKVLDENDNDIFNQESDNDDRSNQVIQSTTTINEKEMSQTSSCTNKYDIKSEQLVKVKELKNGAHMIRYVLIDKRTLSPNLKVKDGCMLACCSEKTCDLAMLSEKPAHEGYKCYLFACNGSCPLASHQDYSVIVPKTDSVSYGKSETTKTDGLSTSTPDLQLSPKKSFFRETSIILFLVFGVVCTTILFMLLCHYCRTSRKIGRKSKNYAVDADYLINGLYL